MTVPLAHIAGVPVEETAEMLAPVAAVTLGALAASLRSRWHGLRVARGRRTGRRVGR